MAITAKVTRGVAGGEDEPVSSRLQSDGKAGVSMRIGHASIATVLVGVLAVAAPSVAGILNDDARPNVATRATVDGRTVAVPTQFATEHELSRDDIVRGWRTFESWASANLPPDERIDHYASGRWVLVPVKSRAIATVGQPESTTTAGYVRCVSRKDSRRGYRAINVFDKEVYRIVGSLPFCVNSLKIKVVRHKAFRSHLDVRPWARMYVTYKDRTNHTQAHYVKWSGKKKGSVRGAAAYRMFLESGDVPAGIHCPRIRLWGLGNTRIKHSGNAVKGC